MKILDTIAAALKGKTALTSTKLADLIAQMETETATTRQRLAELEAKRPDMAIADDADRRRYRSDLASTRDDAEDGEAALQSLRAKHAAAVEAETEDGRKRTYKAAKAEADKLPGLIGEYEKAAQAVRDVVAKIAEIDLTVRTANMDLPAGAAPIADSGRLRSVPAAPREILSEKAVDLWLRPGSADPLPDEYQKTVSPEPDGTGHFPRHGGGASRVFRGRFTRREYREAVTAVHATGFDKIVLPDARVAKSSKERPVLVDHVPYREAA